MGILDNKIILVTGVLTSESIAFNIAKRAQEEGATIILSSFGRALSLTQRVAKRLGASPVIVEIDATSEKDVLEASKIIEKEFGRLDGLVHAIGFAPENALGDDLFKASWEEVSSAIEVSAYSLSLLTKGLLDLLKKGRNSSVIALDFDASYAWPRYGWMGVSKAALESIARYLAKQLGEFNIRINLVASGPLRTVAAKSIPGFNLFESKWQERAPLGWNSKDSEPVADVALCLLSDYFRMLTGQVIKVDGGFSSQGA